MEKEEGRGWEGRERERDGGREGGRERERDTCRFTPFSLRLLSDVSHVIMDEVHERSIQSDFLAIILQDLLPKRLVKCTHATVCYYSLMNLCFPVFEYL